MTRINCVPPAELVDQHLLAEYRELPRIFGMVRKAIAAGRTPKDYAELRTYRLGPGHMQFFYTRLAYLIERQQAIIFEMHRRGFRPKFNDPGSLIEGIPHGWRNRWKPTAKDASINRARIKERLEASASGRSRSSVSTPTGRSASSSTSTDAFGAAIAAKGHSYA